MSGPSPSDFSGLRLTWCGRFCDLKQDGPCLHVADLEPGEVDHVDIFLWGAQVVWNETEKQ